MRFQNVALFDVSTEELSGYGRDRQGVPYVDERPCDRIVDLLASVMSWLHAGFPLRGIVCCL